MTNKIFTLGLGMILLVLIPATAVVSVEVDAEQISLNATHSIDSKNLALYIEAYDLQEVANDKVTEINDNLQTMEGIEGYDSICNWVAEDNPYQILDCYLKNKDKIK